MNDDVTHTILHNLNNASMKIDAIYNDLQNVQEDISNIKVRMDVIEELLYTLISKQGSSYEADKKS